MAPLMPRSWTLYVAALLVLALGGPADAEVTLRPSQAVYEVGEVVSFTLTNGSEHVIKAVSSGAVDGANPEPARRTGMPHPSDAMFDAVPSLP